jgi:hypothetical protein
MSYKLMRKFVETELGSILDGKEQQFSYLVEGPHGIGKSAFWKEICLENNGFFVDIRLGQRDLGDILGLPTIVTYDDGSQHMIHIKPELVRKMFVKNFSELGVMGDENDKLRNERSADRKGMPYDFVLGFLDEYNRGTKDVQQAVFELVYDRSMNGDRIHPKVMLAAACNDNIEIYTITEGDPAFRSRFKTIKYTPTVEEWLAWGRKTGELCDELIFVINSKKDLADPPKDKDIDYLNKPHPNRRSWHEFSKFYTAFKSSFSEIEMRDIAATFVGHDSAEIFRLMAAKMTGTQNAASSAQSAETKKVESFYNMYVRLHKTSNEVAAKELKAFNPSDFQALADHCIMHFNMFNYMTGVTKDRVKGLAELLPEEIFARIWNEIDNKNQLREKMVGHVTAIKQPDFFKKFQLAK